MFKRYFVLFVLLVGFFSTGFGQTFYSKGNDNVNLTGSWFSNTNGTGSNPTNFTTAGQTFYVQNGHLMTASATWTVSGTGSKVVIKTGGQITSGLYNHSLTLDMESGGTWIHSNTTHSNLTFGTLNSNSNFQYNNSSGFAPTRTFPNLIINNVAVNPGSSSVTVNGNLVIKGASGIFRGTSTGTPTHTIGGDVIIESSGTWTLTNGSGSPVYNISGNINNSGGSITNGSSPGTPVINLLGSGKSCTWGTKTAVKHTININASASYTFNDNLSYDTGTLTVNGTLECGTNALTGAGAFVLASGATLKIGSADGLVNDGATGNIRVTGTRTFNFGGIYEYNGLVAQVTGTSLPTAISGTLKINNSAGVTATNGVTVSGTLDLTSGFLNLNDKSFTFSGTVTGSGTLSGSSLSDVTISGTGAFGTLTFTNGSRTLGALTLNRTSSGTVSLGSDLLITVGDLTLTSGHLSLGSSTLTIGSGSDVLTPSSSSFIVTNGVGALKWTIPAATAKVFPVGFSSANYNPVTITNTASKEFSVRAKSGTSNPVVSTAHLPVFWDITPTTVDNLNATIQLQWNGSQESGQVGFDRGVNLEIARWAGSPTGWSTTSATLAGSDPYTAEASGFTSFSEFGVSTNGALPVELTSFTASAKGTAVTLNWETKTEIDNNGFEVEKNSNGTWEKIGFVEGHGTTNSPKYYSFTDNAGIGNKIQYRLKQIDNDGTFEYSPVVEVELNPTQFALYQNYPNPFNPVTVVRYSLPVAGMVTIDVFNSLGEKVSTLVNSEMQAGYHEVSFDAAALPSGLYFYKIQAGEFTSVKKMLLMK